MTDQSLPVFELSPSLSLSLPKNVEWKCEKFFLLPFLSQVHSYADNNCQHWMPGNACTVSWTSLSAFQCRAECTFCYMHSLICLERIECEREGKGKKKGTECTKSQKLFAKLLYSLIATLVPDSPLFCCCPALVFKNSIIALLCVAWENRLASQFVAKLYRQSTEHVHL